MAKVLIDKMDYNKSMKTLQVAEAKNHFSAVLRACLESCQSVQEMI
jgi:hypothetical protein